MSLTEIRKFFEELLAGDPHVLAAFIVGVLATAILFGWAWYYFLRGRPHPMMQKLESDLNHEQAKAATLGRMVDEKEEKIRALSGACEKTKEELCDSESLRQEAEANFSHEKKKFV